MWRYNINENCNDMRLSVEKIYLWHENKIKAVDYYIKQSYNLQFIQFCWWLLQRNFNCNDLISCFEFRIYFVSNFVRVTAFIYIYNIHHIVLKFQSSRLRLFTYLLGSEKKSGHSYDLWRWKSEKMILKGFKRL